MSDDTWMQSQTPLDLWGALGLDAAAPPVVAIVGGGGKTSLLFALGREAARRGVRAVLSGTTRFTRPPGSPPLAVFQSDPAAEVGAALDRDPVIVATSGLEPQERFAALTVDEAEALARIPGLGLLAVEADGSRMLPFKAPAEHEPVIPPSATHVVAVVGADAVDAPLDEAHVHRPERVRALLDGPADRCTVEVITRVLLHPAGGRKGAGERAFAVVVNKADAHPEAANALARALVEAGAPRVVVAALRDAATPVRAVFPGG
jgi:molybdenum cofactor cytidylyltransferase